MTMPPNELTIDFSQLDKIVNPYFYPLIADQHRYLVLKGGAGSSKSWSIVQKLVYRIVAEQGHRFLIMRKVGKTLNNSVIALILGTIASFGLSQLFEYNKSDRTITFTPNGNAFVFQGLANRDDSERLKSIEGITGVWMEEATEFTRQDFTQVDLRLRGKSDHYKQLVLTFNPVNENSWVKSLFFDSDAIIPDKLRIHESTYKDNPRLEQEYIETIENLINVDQQYYNVYALNLWGVLKGLIYGVPMMDEVFPKRFQTVLFGLDFGYSHPMSLTKIGINGQDVYLDELFYETQHTVGDLIEQLPQLGVTKSDKLYCDSARPDDIERLRRAGYRVLPSAKGAGSVSAGISLVKEFTLHSKADNVNLNNEFGLYKWKEDANGNQLDEPIKEFDHGMDGIRYALFTHFGKPRNEVWVI